MIKKIITFFDKLEDRTRIKLSHYPITYAIVGGVGIILFWKGVWETAEIFPVLFGPMSMIIGIAILLMTGLMVSFFVGDSIILSGFNREKKLAEKTEEEVHSEKETVQHIVIELETIEMMLKNVKEKLDQRRS
ncbi:hypothetical protein A3A36_02390 [Candidatus Kaiserbacteria bacterium RIFCSPLOWO2_01_FULL_52_12b]|uniref:Uncharacterized protein n=1 Tax=Candidatus Kaiserbacteria bacterium RIFCSPLOWO2_01_FULL_52_12b TaxID=1798509 RepID=A0A1F6EWA0_9BACT|nr:MAG: hypothetical protein A3A36_02390 [Candidatus Kaiserbacteria bacterium RIFCSPLOWO2_01_FULL_52_12b]